VAEVAGALALAGTLMVLGLPRVAQAPWSEIGEALAAVGPGSVALLTAVWLAGLWAQTIAIAAALPGLSHRRAFFLNITGSAVSNLLPLGGTAGTVLNYGTCRAWGFRTSAFVRWALVTNIWDVLGRLAVPGIALLWLDSWGLGDDRLAAAAVGSALVLAALAVVTVLVLRGDAGAHHLGRLSDRFLATVRRSSAHDPSEAGLPTPDGPGPAELRALAVRRSMVALIRVAWPRLTVGKALYAAAQAALLWLCLDAVGSAPTGPVVLAAFAVERVLSLAVITPGATGLVELGMTGYLVHAGTDPAAAAAGILLYRFFVIGLEVPVGAALLGLWSAARLRSRRSPAPPEAVAGARFGMPRDR
jgi:uncharacterized membrane protein YbhN (UPF0104 family)